MRERHAAEFAEFVTELREQVNARGYNLDDVIARLRKGRSGKSAKRAAGSIMRYVDPDKPERPYTRGPLPNWLREKMEAAGYAPAGKAQRQKFKESHLRLAA